MTTHIEEFADRLSGLKERSGHSYGMLAARLHVSTSTLHRYCNGAAVPGDYAPVERFARQCGASAEELVALHRCWLLADAVRRREPDRAQATTAKPSAAAGLPEAPAASAVPAGSAASAASAVPSAAPAAAEVPARPEGPDRPEGRDVPDVPGPSDTREAPDLPDVADAPAAPAARGERPPRLPRRTGIALAAAAALLAAVLPLVLRAGPGGGDARAPAARPHPTAAATRPAASASASGRKGASAAAGAAAPSTAGAPATGSAPPQDSAGPPVQVTVLADNWDTQCDQWFLLRQQPGRVPPPPSLQQTDAWGAALGGIPAQDLRLQLTAQGLPGEPVVLHALYVKVVSSAAAPKGNGYTPGSGCGGGIEPASFAVDLDAAVPRARAVSGTVGDGQGRATADFPFQVSAGGPQVLDVDAHTLDHDVSWYLDLVWSRGSRQGTLRVDDHGAPFRTVGLKGDPAYFYDGVKWAPAAAGN